MPFHAPTRALGRAPSSLLLLFLAPLLVAIGPARAAGAAGAGPSDQARCLAEAIYFEARGESAAGQAAVAQVVLNRTRRAGWPKTVCGVVRQRGPGAQCQFSFICEVDARPRDRAAWRRAWRVAQRALDGYVMRAVGRCDSFRAARLGPPRRGATRLGGQVFYVARRAPPAPRRTA